MIVMELHIEEQELINLPRYKSISVWREGTLTNRETDDCQVVSRDQELRCVLGGGGREVNEKKKCQCRLARVCNTGEHLLEE